MKNCAKPEDWGRTLAFLLLRVWLGLRALVAGIDKFSGTRTTLQPLLDMDGQPDPSGAMVEVQEKVYALAHYQAMPASMRLHLEQEPLLPGFLSTPFYYALGPALILLGLTLLLGICTRVSLFAMGLIYAALTVGLILLKQDGGVAWLGTHILLVVAALVLVAHNRWTVTRT
jgi:thiosulfate dehydrogenase [quinone] large subunit